MNNIVLEPSHPMASSNTGNSLVFRNSVGNYMSRKAYLELLASKEGCVSHKYLSPNESAWLMANRVR
jgi:hypothetical protein